MNDAPLSPGRIVGTYEIVSRLGEGGMGEVFLARDSRLGRQVALKVLREDSRPDESLRRRFAQEAQTASALNHLNIVSVYDVGSWQGLDFIAMEYVEGRTVRQLLANGPLPLRQALDYVAQAAAGLAAAHDAHIVHRDIKPENLVVTRQGQVKILDFGVAKLTEKQRGVLAAEAATSTATPAMTRAGTIVGTTAYMSPEQAQGHELDAGSDIFSLGSVLYEMLAGRRAFDGKSAIDVLHAIINDTPREIREIRPDVPIEVADVLDKALAKDRSERYRHAGDLALDARRCKRAFETGTLPSLLVPDLPPTPRRAIAVRWAAAMAIGALLGAGGLSMVPRSAAPVTSADRHDAVVLTPLTTDPGYEGDPSLSSDGETLVYVSDRTGNFEIFVRQVSGGADINITNDPAADMQPSLSPDGRQVAFVSSRDGATELLFPGPNTPAKGGDVWVIPTLGGNARRVATGGNFPGWSPDGRDLVYTSGTWFGPRLHRVSASGGTPRQIPLQFPPGVSPAHLLYPQISGDGRWIVLSSSTDIYVVAAEGGAVRAIARGQSPAWGADSRSIIYTSDEAGANQSLWTLAFNPVDGVALGTPRPLTIGRGADLRVAASKDGNSMAFAATTISTQVEIQAFDAERGQPAGAATPLTISRDQIYFFDISTDGSAALFELRRGQASSIWRTDGTGRLVQLASDSRYDHTNPLWSPDMRTIAFSRRPVRSPDQPFSLWTMAADGANIEESVERLVLNGLFTWMPDGKGIVHVGQGRQLYLLDLASKTGRQLTNEPGVMPVVTVTADGKWLIYQCVVADTVDIHAVPIEGGDARVVVTGPAQDYHPFVSPSGRWVYYMPDHKDVYRVPGPAQGWRQAQPERITELNLTPISFIENPQWSRDGTKWAYSRGRITSDIWLLTRQ